MGKIDRWLKNKAASLYIAMSDVEKNAFNQKGETLETNVNQHQRLTQGQLADSLINGELTQEVIDLRWRTYKILEETNKFSTKITGYDKNNKPIYKTVLKDNDLKNIKLDLTDSYELEMIINNEPITVDINTVIGSSSIEEVPEEYASEEKNVKSIALFKSSDFENIKNESPIMIDRTFYPKFFIENFAKKLYIRKINEEEKLLEFFVSKYSDSEDKKTLLFINEINKAINNQPVNFLDILSVNFFTYKSVGVNDFLIFKYEDLKFDKITDFNGFYLIKFKAKVTVNGESMVEKFKSESLEERYKNKTRKE